MGPVAYDVDVMIQIIRRYYSFFYYGEKHGIVGKKLNIGFNIPLKIIGINQE